METGYVERDLHDTFHTTRKAHPIVAVVGPRQAGKTTFLKHQMSNDASYVLFDDPDAQELFTDIKKFDKQYVQGHPVAVLDEIQYCEDPGQKLKYLADTGRTLWITSSSETLLRKEVFSKLVGRVSICRLYPFNLDEFLRAKGQKELTASIQRRMLWEHATYGGYPKTVLTDDTALQRDILSNLLETILLKDVSQAFSIQDVDALQSLTNYLALQAGQPVKYQTLSDELDISFKTLKKYLTALEQSYIIKRVKPFHTNRKKEIVKRPQIYFLDTGLRNALTTFPDELDGLRFENYVYTELIKHGHDPKYWRTKTQAEVDFVVNGTPVEVKLRCDTIPNGVKSFCDRYSPDTAVIVRASGENKSIETDDPTIQYTDPYEMHAYLD